MAIVNEIKCARCDRKYSGVRSRCPYCGARRIGRGKYSEDSENAKGKMLISVIILAVFTVAAGVLLFTTPVDADAQDPADDPSLSSLEDDIDTVQGLHTPTPAPTPTPSPEPVLQNPISSVVVIYGGSPLGESFTLAVNEELPLNLRIEPVDFDRGDDFNVEWESSNPSVFDVVEVVMGVEGRFGANAFWHGEGTATLTVTVTNNGEDYEWSCTVFGRGS